MNTNHIFAGLKVVDLSSFLAGPGAATVLSDFGADVIKVEPPGIGDPHRVTYKIPPFPSAKENYSWHLSNRNKRGLAVDLKSPRSREILERLVKWADVLVVNFPRPVRKKLKLTYEDIAPWNPRLVYADITGYGDEGPDTDLPGFDITAYWSRSGLLDMTRDAGAPPTLPVPASGDHATAMGLYSAIVTGLYRRERTGEGCYVTTSLLSEGIWASAVLVQAALCNAKFYPLHDQKNPPNAIYNVYQTSDNRWFLIVMQPKDWPALPAAIGRPELLSDPRFADDAARAKNSAQLAAIPGSGLRRPTAGTLARRFRARSHHIRNRQDSGRSYHGSPGSDERDHRADRRRRRALDANRQQPDQNSRCAKSKRAARAGTWRAQRRSAARAGIQRGPG
jgi:crotonobetainyl-CoA:carnitine CoA-transferase CaiB-like acyl-CoA transferase